MAYLHSLNPSISVPTKVVGKLHPELQVPPKNPTSIFEQLLFQTSPNSKVVLEYLQIYTRKPTN